jgi:transcription elongation factor GreA
LYLFFSFFSLFAQNNNKKLKIVKSTTLQGYYTYSICNFFYGITLNKNNVMAKLSYYTQEGLDKLKDELNYQRTKGRAEIARQIAEARDKGDLSENAEYDAAKDAQGLLEAKIAKLEELISNARLVDVTNMDPSKVSILSTVRVKNLKINKEFTYTLVAEEEADLKLGKISIQSPIGKALTGKSVGDKVDAQAPAGIIPFEILEITR